MGIPSDRLAEDEHVRILQMGPRIGNLSGELHRGVLMPSVRFCASSSLRSGPSPKTRRCARPSGSRATAARSVEKSFGGASLPTLTIWTGGSPPRARDGAAPTSTALRITIDRSAVHTPAASPARRSFSETQITIEVNDSTARSARR